MTLREWCRANWNKLPELVRKDCVDHLDGWIHRDAIEVWKKNDYWDNGHFHLLGGGMQIRNRLRDQLTDAELSVVTTDHEGKPYGPSRNWDDYYTGALDELMERYL
jgi:hypothetical protein